MVRTGHRSADQSTEDGGRWGSTAVPHHLIDVVDPDEHYDAHRYRCDCIEVIRNIHRRSAVPLLTGGTGLYLRSLRTGFFDIGSIPAAIRSQVREEIVERGSKVVHEEMLLYDYFSARNIHPNDTYRLARAVEVYRATGRPISEHQRAQKAQQSFANMLVVGLTCERDELYKRINLRTTVMIEGGLEEEVTGLLDKGYSPELKPMQSIGYRHMINYLKGKDTLDEMRELLARDTRRYAKRQYTWFNRDGSIKWFDKREEKEVLSYIELWLDHKRSSGVKGG